MTEQLTWHTARASKPDGNCVEAAKGSDGNHHVRDSKDRAGTMLTLTPQGWAAFTAGIRSGQFG